MKLRRTLFFFAAVAISAFAVATAQESEDSKPEAAPAKEKPVRIEDIHAIVKTSKGDIKIVLFAEKAPVTAANFLNLAKRDYYDKLLFHRVSPGFVVQVGDPLTLDPKKEEVWGRGGPGYYIELEVDPDLNHHSAGVLSMARKLQGTDTAGSQFFITLDTQPHLDGKFAVFGEVTEGIEIVHEIVKGDKILDVEVLDSTDALFAKMERRIAEWNQKLNQRSEAQKKAAVEEAAAEKAKAAADAAAAAEEAKAKAKAEAAAKAKSESGK